MSQIYDFENFIVSQVQQKAREQEPYKKAVLGKLLIPKAKEVAEKAGMDITWFHLEERSMYDYVHTPFTGGISRSPYLDLNTPFDRYRIGFRLHLTDPDHLDHSPVGCNATLFWLRNYRSGNRNWEYFSGSKWKDCGEEIFDT